MVKAESLEDFLKRGGAIERVSFDKSYSRIKNRRESTSILRSRILNDERLHAITKEIILQEAKYDKINGTLIKNNSKIYHTDENRYIYIFINFNSYPVHRLVWFLENGKWPENIIDHINGNKRDNRIENLRDSTARQNSQNRKEHRNGRLVGATTSRNKWRSSATINGKTVVFGFFKTELEAHNKYKEELTKRGIECL